MYAIVDCNNFYASCEEVFNPKLSKKPLVILSNNDGIVIARSKKAKEIGIPMGVPIFEYKDRIKSGEIATLSCNFSLYADMSNRVMQSLESFGYDMEIYSIDEAFLRLSDRNQALLIRKSVKQWTGIPISIGIAPTKTLAKLANRSAKKSSDGVFVLTEPSDIQKQLETTPLHDIWGIGHRTAQHLKKKNIHSLAQLCQKEDGWIRKTFGVALYRTLLELKGTPCIEMLEDSEKKQSIACTRSFSPKIDSLAALQEAVASFASRASEKLRGQNSKASFLSVFITTSPFEEPYESKSCHFHLPNATAYAPELIALAKEGVARMYKQGLNYKKAGVILAEFTDGEAHQFDLLSPDPSREKKEAAMRIVDQINARYDKAAVRFLAEGHKEWKGIRSNVSPHYTTDWKDLLSI